MNLARAHFERQNAKQTAEKMAVYGEMQHATTYELKLANLANDKHRLKQLQSLELKNDLKTRLIDDYIPYCEGVLSSGGGVQDEVLMTIMVWCIDLRRYDFALKIARYALQHELIMPDNFKRCVACVVVEEIAEIEIKRLKQDESAAIDTLESLHELLNDDSLSKTARDMPDEVRAKLYLAIGRHYLMQAKEIGKGADLAVNALSAALSLHDKCGGKSDLAQAKKLAAA
ncbi:terminase [Moraxella haemolytica]|uniref:phage terminase small subunit n=1 Tax=Moraxella haemolytica TaxID=2904119 RepID=UPI0025426DB9|nr:phage terminase small subunit [Moraxella sp. ZY171148]WII94718.1 terminase [Moraxella sp. ZY171148]